jgi:uncharacterized protein (TIGR03790 family)
VRSDSPAVSARPLFAHACRRGPDRRNVAVVINEASPESKQIGEYYIKARGIPAANVVRLQTTTDETIQPGLYQTTIQAPIAAALLRTNAVDRILYIVLTKGVPLRVLAPLARKAPVRAWTRS